MPQVLVALHVRQPATVGTFHDFVPPGLAAESSQAGQRSQKALPLTGIPQLDVPGHQFPIGGFTGQDAHHLPRLDGSQRPVEADCGRGQQRLGAPGIDAEGARRVANAKLQHLDAKRFGRPKVPQFMHHHQQQQHRYERCQRNQPRIHKQKQCVRLVRATKLL